MRTLFFPLILLIATCVLMPSELFAMHAENACKTFAQTNTPTAKERNMERDKKREEERKKKSRPSAKEAKRQEEKAKEDAFKAKCKAAYERVPKEAVPLSVEFADFSADDYIYGELLRAKYLKNNAVLIAYLDTDNTLALKKHLSDLFKIESKNANYFKIVGVMTTQPDSAQLKVMRQSKITFPIYKTAVNKNLVKPKDPLSVVLLNERGHLIKSGTLSDITPLIPEAVANARNGEPVYGDVKLVENLSREKLLHSNNRAVESTITALKRRTDDESLAIVHAYSEWYKKRTDEIESMLNKDPLNSLDIASDYRDVFLQSQPLKRKIIDTQKNTYLPLLITPNKTILSWERNAATGTLPTEAAIENVRAQINRAIDGEKTPDCAKRQAETLIKNLETIPCTKSQEK